MSSVLHFHYFHVATKQCKIVLMISLDPKMKLSLQVDQQAWEPVWSS